MADISEEVSVVKEALGKAAEEIPYSGRGTPTPMTSPSTSPGSVKVLDSKLEDEVALVDLVTEGEWTAALKHARQNRFCSVSLDFNLIFFFLKVLINFCFLQEFLAK